MSEFGDELGGHAHANLEAVMVRVWSYAMWRPRSSQLGGRDRARLDEYLEAVYGRRNG